jgi:hypothetical protein
VAHAGGIADVLRSPQFEHLEMAPIAPALASTVASTYPVASASSSITYVYDPVLETMERRTTVAGPIIGERAETIGRGQINLATAYSYVHLTTIDGDDLDHLVNAPWVNGRAIVFPVRGGLTLANGRFTNFLPVHVVADLDVEAHIVAPSITYGITPDLDFNLTLPLLYTSLAVTAHTRVPDPRFPQFALVPGDPNAQASSRSESDDAVGIGDVLLRAKYLLLRSSWIDVAVQLGLSLPTGNEDDLQGTGTTRVQPTLVLSHVFADRIEPLLNVGVDYDADAVGRSVVRWAAGATARVVGPVSAAFVVLARHELAAQSDQIANPFFFQLERNDQYDAALDMRWGFAEQGSLGLNVTLPLNGQGLRPEVIPTLVVEYAF